MIQPFVSEFLNPTKKFRSLSILLAIHNDPKISQHKIGKSTNLSSSMVNNYMKMFQEKGLVKFKGKTNRTQSYYLTATGQNKLISSLLAYSAEIIQLYSSAKRALSSRLNSMYSEGIKKIIMFGAAETAEVVHAAMQETPLKAIAVLDSDTAKQGKPFNGFTIQKPEKLEGISADAVLITSFGKQKEIYRQIREIAGEKIIIKKLSDL